MSYFKEFYIDGKKVKTLYLNGKNVKLQESPVLSYLCFTAEQANSTVTLSAVGSPASVSLYTSTDGNTWSNYTIGSTLTLANVDDKIMFKGTNSKFSTAERSNYYQFAMTGKIAASGMVDSLLNGENPANSVPAYGFNRLFNNCTSLTTAPEIKALTLNTFSLKDMFNGCTNLRSAHMPEATNVSGNYCLNSLFYGCSSLTSVTGEFKSAWTINQGSCEKIFMNCTALTEGPTINCVPLDQPAAFSNVFEGSGVNVIRVSWTSWPSN